MLNQPGHIILFMALMAGGLHTAGQIAIQVKTRVTIIDGQMTREEIQWKLKQLMIYETRTI